MVDISSKNIIVGITGWTDKHWQGKLEEIRKFKINRIGLFVEQFRERKRKEIYGVLLNSGIKEIPLVHIRNDVKKSELLFLKNNFEADCFTIHEPGFGVLNNWRGFQKNLYLEMNSDSRISSVVDVSKIGGFCVDLAHFKVEEAKRSREFDYISKRKRARHYFYCNHISGYSFERNKDVHRPRKITDFNYLKILPQFVFGKILAIEVYNSIAEQLKFKEYILKLIQFRR